jgi:hypothetical protein
MAKAIPLRKEGPEFRVVVSAGDRLILKDVASFLQRLDTGSRRVATWHGVPAPTIQIVSLSVGSPLDVKLKLGNYRVAKGALAISAAVLAMNVAQYLRDDPAANRASRALIEGDHNTIIIVQGGGREERIQTEDLEAAQQYQVAAAARADPGYELLTGPQSGFVRYFGGENWVELDARPGLIIRIRDQREVRSGLREDARYRLFGEAHISPPRRGQSFFLLEDALLLD